VPFVINGTMFPAGKYIVLGESSSVLLIRGVHDAGRSCGQVPEVIRRLERDGATFRVVEPADVSKVIAELRGRLG
jgi:hypothetical protein